MSFVMFRRLVLTAFVMLMVACASKDTVPATGAADTGLNTLRHDTASYTLQPGEEKYFCYTMSLPTDKETVVTEFAPEYGKAVHHFAYYYTIVAEPEGFSECPVLIKTTWIPLFEGGKDSGKLSLPPGAGVRLNGNQLLIQLHLVNSTKAPITEKSAMVMTTVPAATKTTNAGLFGFDNREIDIPAKTSDYERTMTCKVEKDMDVFAIMGHLHTRGKHIEVSRGATPGAEVLYSTTWNFDIQPTTPIKLSIKKGDNIHLRCKWDNETDKVIKYGESTYDEMCAFVWYYTPYDGLDGCIHMPPT
jgi:hypothetical protein